MYSVDEIRDVQFRKAGRGYKAEDVDIFVDQIAADFEIIMREITNLKGENNRLNEEIKNTACSQSSLQNVLISAQRLADQIVEEAKQKAEEILTDAQKNANEITRQIEIDKENCDKNITEANKSAQAEIENLLKESLRKSEAMKAAAKDSVEREQILFDKLKTEIVSFKSQIMDMYKEHLGMFSQIPDEVPFDAARAAKVVAAKIDAEPDFDSFIPAESQASVQADINNEETVEPEEVKEADKETPAEPQTIPADGATRIVDIPSLDETDD